MGKKIIQRQEFITEISYFCNRIETTLSKTYQKKKKRYANLVFGNLRNFQIVYEKKHSGSHAIAWAAITTSYTLRFSQDLQYKAWHS